MPTNLIGRPYVTPTNFTGRPSISGFQSYTWVTAPDIWSAVSDTWDTYGTISTGTQLTGRPII